MTRIQGDRINELLRLADDIQSRDTETTRVMDAIDPVLSEDDWNALDTARNSAHRLAQLVQRTFRTQTYSATFEKQVKTGDAS